MRIDGTQEEKNKKIQKDLKKLVHDERRGDGGVSKYLKEKKVFKGQKQPKGRAALEHKRKAGTRATWTFLQEEFNKCHDVLLQLKWYKADGTLADRDAAHYVTIANVEKGENDAKCLRVANPWGESHHVVNKKNRDDAYEKLDVTVNDNGTIRVDNKELETAGGGIKDAEYLCVTAINVIRPVDPGQVNVPPAVAVAERTKGAPGKAGGAMQRYEYAVTNEESTPLNYFGLILRVPYDFVEGPPGWIWEPLPASYPGQEGCGPEIGPNGVLWTTDTDPIPPGEQLGGFAFEVDDIYPFGEEGPITYTDTEGLEGSFGFVAGPVPRGDHDGDDDTDLFDFQSFLDCVTGPGGGVPPGCEVFDFDEDNDVDFDDFAVFQEVFTGL